MVENLCSEFGEKLCTYEGKTFYTFPAISHLAEDGVEEKLRKLGFGYRAKYISQTAKFIEENHDPQWLYSLRKVNYENAHKELTNLPGVGAKVRILYIKSVFYYTSKLFVKFSLSWGRNLNSTKEIMSEIKLS